MTTTGAITEAAGYLKRWASPSPASPVALDLRAAAREKLPDLTAVPNRKTEAWRYVNLLSLLNAELTAVQQSPVFARDVGGRKAGGRKAGSGTALWEVQDGFCGYLGGDLPAGVRVAGLEMLADENAEFELLLSAQGSGYPFDALNLVAISDALIIDVLPGVCLTEPLHIRYASSGNGQAQHALVILRLGEGAHCTLIEEDTEHLRGYLNARLLVQQAAGASLHHQRLQCQTHGWQIRALDVRLAADARYELVQASLGSQLKRNDLTIRLSGQGAQADLKGAYLSTAKQQLDNHLTIEHAKPGGQSNTLFRGLAGGHGRAVFNGRILIEPNAGQTVADLQNRNLLLSEGAEINTKPELEIYASDVRCAHGATVGQLDPEAIFYCMSRGISCALARRLLAFAFVNEIMEAVKGEASRALWLACLESEIAHG